jgi:hypothetical protein
MEKFMYLFRGVMDPNQRIFPALALLALFSFTHLNGQYYSITTIAGVANEAGYAGDGIAATSAPLCNPIGTAEDNNGNIFISDWCDCRIRIVNSNGIISTFAGLGVLGYSGDGAEATAAELNGPAGICFDANGNLYIADIGNNRIRKVTKSGIISTVAGNGIYGYSGDGGAATAAEFSDPTGVAADKRGNIFITDVFNNRIRKIDTSGIITTVAGSAVRGFAGDGDAATAAELYYPTGIAIDNSGNIYFADGDNNRVRKVDTVGIITTIAGNGVAGYSGDGSLGTGAELYDPDGVAIDKTGNIFIADGVNYRIRKLDLRGIISTVAGNGTGGFGSNSNSATTVACALPTCISSDTAGNIYIPDEFSNEVQKLTIAPENPVKEIGTIVYPNPNYGIFTIQILNPTPNLQVEIYNVLGQRIQYSTLNTSITLINLYGCSKGVYLYRIITESKVIVSQGRVVVI